MERRGGAVACRNVQVPCRAVAEIGNIPPTGPVWPGRPVKPAGHADERKPKRQPPENERRPDDDDEDAPTIDEYA